MRYSVMTMLAATALATAACGEPAAPAAAAAPAPIIPPTLAVQPDTAGAEVFVRALYASYSSAEDANPLSGDAVWSRRMQALIQRDQELATEDLPFLDADPICNCQDWENLSVREVRLAPGPDGATDATVRFVNAGEETTQVLRLVRESGGWRVDDIPNPGYPSLADALAQSNARIEAGGRALYRD